MGVVRGSIADGGRRTTASPPTAVDVVSTNLHGAVTFVIYGEPAAKANSRRLVTVGRGRSARSRVIKSGKALAYVESLRRQAQALWRKRGLAMFTGRVRIGAVIYYASERPDLDGSLILDGLQGIAFANDRQVRDQHWIHRIDRVAPRAEITLAEARGVAQDLLGCADFVDGVER